MNYTIRLTIDRKDRFGNPTPIEVSCLPIADGTTCVSVPGQNYSRAEIDIVCDTLRLAAKHNPNPNPEASDE